MMVMTMMIMMNCLVKLLSDKTGPNGFHHGNPPAHRGI